MTALFKNLPATLAALTALNSCRAATKGERVAFGMKGAPSSAAHLLSEAGRNESGAQSPPLVEWNKRSVFAAEAPVLCEWAL